MRGLFVAGAMHTVAGFVARGLHCLDSCMWRQATKMNRWTDAALESRAFALSSCVRGLIREQTVVVCTELHVSYDLFDVMLGELWHAL